MDITTIAVLGGSGFGFGRPLNIRKLMLAFAETAHYLRGVTFVVPTWK